MAGTELELDIRDGLSPFNLNEMRRAFRRDKFDSQVFADWVQQDGS